MTKTDMSSTDYTCRNAACDKRGKSILEVYANLAGGKCPSCGHLLSAVTSELSETAQRVIESYPGPIALSLQLLHEKVDVEARAKSLVDVFTNVLKLQAMVVLSEYLRSDIVDDNLTQIIRKKLARPLVSGWITFLEASLTRLEDEGHKFFAPELKMAYESAETKRKKNELIDLPEKGYYDLDGDFIETKTKLALVRALGSYRNKFSHGLNQTEKESRKEFDFYLGVLETLLDEMAWMADYTLLKREGDKVWRMMGAEPQQVEMPWPEEVSTSLALLCPESERALVLFPLLIVPREYITEVADGEDLLIYDQDTGKRLQYVSPRGHCRVIEGTHRDWHKLLEAKEVILPALGPDDLTPEELATRAQRVTADAEELLHASRKVLKGIYVQREDSEGHLRFFPGTSFPLALVTSQAGGGKTSLLHHLANEWAKQDMSVVLLRAMAIKGSDLMSALRDELRLSNEVDAKSLAERGASDEHPLIIVLDGLNENGQREALLASILALAEEVRETCHLKLVLSWRSEQSEWTEAAKQHVKLFLPEPESSSTKDDEIPRLHLGPWSHDDVKKLWKTLQKSDKKSEKKRFLQSIVYEQVYERNRATAELLKNPLMVRLFLEAFRDEKLPGQLSYQSIFEQWLKKLGERTRDDNRFLYDLARILMEGGSTAVDLDSLYDDPRTKELVRRTDVASPFDKLVHREGVLAELSSTDGVKVSFTMDRFLEQAAGSTLIEDGQADRPEDLVGALERLKKYPLATEIVKVALTRRVDSEGRKYLWDFLDVVPPDEASVADELVGRLVQETQEPATIAAELMASPGEGSLDAALGAGAYLRSENLFTLTREFWEPVEQSAKALPASHRLALFYDNLGGLFRDLGEHEQAREYYEKSLAIVRDIYGEQHPDVAISYNNLGTLLSALGEHEQAREYYEKSLAIFRDIYGEQHPDIAASYNNLGTLFRDLGEHEQAREYYEKSLAIARDIYGEQHPKVATSYGNLGLLLHDLGEHEQAREYYEKSLAIVRDIYGEQHPDIAASYGNLALLLRDLGEHERAREYLEKSLAIARDIYGEQHPDVAVSYGSLGLLLRDLGEHEQAREHLKKSLAIVRDIYGEQHPKVAASYDNLGMLLSDLGEHEQAREYLEKSLDIDRDIFGEQHPDVAVSYNNLGLLLSYLGEHEQAREYLEKSLDIRLKIFGEQHRDVATSYNNLGLLLRDLGEHEQAREYLEKSLDIFRDIYGEQHPIVAASYNNLCMLLSDLGEH